MCVCVFYRWLCPICMSEYATTHHVMNASESGFQFVSSYFPLSLAISCYTAKASLRKKRSSGTSLSVAPLLMIFDDAVHFLLPWLHRCPGTPAHIQPRVVDKLHQKAAVAEEKATQLKEAFHKAGSRWLSLSPSICHNSVIIFPLFLLVW